MASLFGLLGIARDGMAAQAYGLNVTGQNVSNVNTPGYVRRSALLETRGHGLGVAVQGTARSFDRFVYGRVLTEQGKQGSASARGASLGDVEGIVAPASGGISEKLDTFFRALMQLSGTAGDMPARIEALTRSRELAETISQTAATLAQKSSDVITAAQGVSAEVNEKLARIASLNEQIAAAQGQGDHAADLRDNRNELLRDVSARIGAHFIDEPSGGVTVFAAGTVLVEGNTAGSLSVDVDGAGLMRISLDRPSGRLDITRGVDQGALGGLREFRDTDLATTRNTLDKFAFDLANAVNGLHASGVGLDGVSGRPLFTPPLALNGAAYSLSVDASLLNDPRALAASSTVAGLPSGGDNARAMANLATASLGGGGLPREQLASWVADVGSRKSAADNDMAMRQDTTHQAEILHESASGVSLDDETISLTKYQRAFEASARVLRTADELLQNLLRELG